MKFLTPVHDDCSPDRRLRREVLIVQLIFTAVVAFAVAREVLTAPTLPDFAAIWAAQHVANPYDDASITRLLGSGGHLFSYPPTTLALTWPLRLLAYEPGYLTWVALSACALVAALRSAFAPVLLAAPAVFLAGINGQTSLFMAALLLGAAQLDSRPWIAGLLYGLAACLKPQLGLLIPLFLLAAGQWRTIMAAAAAVGAIAALATLAWGLRAWTDWAASLQAFLAANDTAWAHRYLSLPGHWRLVALALGAAGAVLAGRRKDSELGVFICVGAGLLGSLHAMDYDQAVLAAFAFHAARRGRLQAVAFLVPLLFPPSRWATLALTAFAGMALRRSHGRKLNDGEVR